MLKVWGRANSINVQKVLWTLAELGVDYERVDAGMAFGVVETPEYKALNPNSKIPTLEDDGFVLWESNVIVRYLSAKFGLGTLCPEDLQARFDAERWMDWQATGLNAAIAPIFLGLIRSVPQFSDPAFIDATRQTAEGLMALLDAHLADRDFMTGPAFTMADIPVGAMVYRWTALPIERQSRPNLEHWLARLAERPGYANHVSSIPLS